MAKRVKTSPLPKLDELLKSDFPKPVCIYCSEYLFDELLLHKYAGDEHKAYINPLPLLDYEGYRFIKELPGELFSEGEIDYQMMVDLSNSSLYDNELIIYFVYKDYYSRFNIN